MIEIAVTEDSYYTKFSLSKLILMFGGILIIAAGVGCSGWQNLTTDNPTTGDQGSSNMSGEKLAGTDDILPQGDQNFSVSPDGIWILYPIARTNPFEPAYILYDLKKQERHEIGLSARVRDLAAEGRGPLVRAGCWSPDGTQVFLPGNNILYVLDVGSTNLQWDVIEQVDSQEFLYYYECPSLSPDDITSIIRVYQPSDLEIQLVDVQNPEIILARHQALGIGVNRIDFQYPTVSPDGNQIAYIVNEYRGSFIGSSQGYILNIILEEPAGPQFLANPIFGPVRWSPDNNFVYASASGSSDSKGIYRWEVN